MPFQTILASSIRHAFGIIMFKLLSAYCIYLIREEYMYHDGKEEHRLSQMAVRKSLRARVSGCVIIESCRLELNESVGQGTYS